MESNFSAARDYIEGAYNHLCGSDDVSKRLRKALELLTEALHEAEAQTPPNNVVALSSRRRT